MNNIPHDFEVLANFALRLLIDKAGIAIFKYKLLYY